jgi:hypothetical protein
MRGSGIGSHSPAPQNDWQEREHSDGEADTRDRSPNRSVAVNALILYDLAKRAERHGDPYENLAAMYRIGEVGWARGDYHLVKAGKIPSAKETD